MPKRTQSWVNKELHPIFQMNLPDAFQDIAFEMVQRGETRHKVI